jgi:hypothetical protein
MQVSEHTPSYHITHGKNYFNREHELLILALSYSKELCAREEEMAS